MGAAIFQNRVPLQWQAEKQCACNSGQSRQWSLVSRRRSQNQNRELAASHQNATVHWNQTQKQIHNCPIDSVIGPVAGSEKLDSLQ